MFMSNRAINYLNCFYYYQDKIEGTPKGFLFPICRAFYLLGPWLMERSAARDISFAASRIGSGT